MSLVLAGCSKPAAAPQNPRVAIAAFDNQGPAADQWIGTFFALAPTYQLQKETAMAALSVDDSEGWRQSGVGRVVSGTYRRDSQGIRIEARLTDALTGAVLGQYEGIASEGDLGQKSAQMLERLLAVKTVALAGQDADWIEFSKVLASKNAEQLEAFVSGHAAYAVAYPVLARHFLQTGRREEALALLTRFPQGGDALSKAQLELILAADVPARLRALNEISRLRAGDPGPMSELGALASGQGQWDVAAAQYRQLTRLQPTNLEWWNLLGYAEAQQNRLPEAVAALNEYRKLAPNEPNAIDSLAEVHYLNRKFREAGQYFDEQMTRFPAFQNGAGLRKAAFAYFYAGDLKTADARFEDWMKRVLARAPPSAQAFQRAMWLARTGRAEAAKGLLVKERDSSSGQRKAIADLHLAMIVFGLEGKRPAPAWLQQAGTAITDADASNQLSVFAVLSQPAASLEELQARIAAAVPQPQLADLKGQLLAAAAQLMSPATPMKAKVFALPNAADGPVDALLLRSRLAVLP